MNVGSVNSVAFSGTRKTASGNDYEKCNTGKIAGLTFGVLKTTLAMRTTRFQSTVDELVKNSTAISKEIKPEYIKRMKNVSVGLGALIAIGVWTGIGALIDGAINSSRRNNADKTAIKDEKLEKLLEQKIRKEVLKEVQQKTCCEKAEKA